MDGLEITIGSPGDTRNKIMFRDVDGFTYPMYVSRGENEEIITVAPLPDGDFILLSTRADGKMEQLEEIASKDIEIIIRDGLFVLEVS